MLTEEEIEAKLENDWEGLDSLSLVQFVQDEFLRWLEYNAPEYVWQNAKDNKDIRKVVKMRSERNQTQLDNPNNPEIYNPDQWNDWGHYLECKEDEEFHPYYNDIDADISQDYKCPKCGGSWRYEGFSRIEVLTYYDGEPEFTDRHIYSFLICDDCQYAWSI